MDGNGQTAGAAPSVMDDCVAAIARAREVSRLEDSAIVVRTDYHWPNHAGVEVRLTQLGGGALEASDMGVLSKIAGGDAGRIAELVKQSPGGSGLTLDDGEVLAVFNTVEHAHIGIVSVAEVVASVARALQSAD